MPVIAITCGRHSAPRQLIRVLSDTYGAAVLTDADIVKLTGRTQGLDEELILRVVMGKSIPHNVFTHDRERSISGLKKTLADAILKGNCIFTGIISSLLPHTISHLFRILCTAPAPVRIQRAKEAGNLSEGSARTFLEQADHQDECWIKKTTGKNPQDRSLYHMVIAGDPAYANGLMDARIVSQLADQIKTALAEPPFNRHQPQEISDFCISANVEVALSPVGTGLLVDTQGGKVTVTLDRKVMNLSKMQQQIIAAATAVPGVETVKTKIGPNYYKGNILKDFNTGPPPGYQNRP